MFAVSILLFKNSANSTGRRIWRIQIFEKPDCWKLIHDVTIPFSDRGLATRFFLSQAKFKMNMEKLILIKSKQKITKETYLGKVNWEAASYAFTSFHSSRCGCFVFAILWQFFNSGRKRHQWSKHPVHNNLND